MLPLLLALVAVPTPDGVAKRAVATSPATASVRIVRAAELRIDRMAAGDESLLRKTQLRERDGSVHAASLIEFY